jgi:5-methylcytosine-specific restriction endonuclease McrA
MGNPLGTKRWRRIRAQVLETAQDCALCGLPLNFDAKPASRWSPSVDHIIPLSLGGDPFDDRNLRATHHGCNSSRGNGTRQQPRHARAW